jgi:hypothetical protein
LIGATRPAGRRLLFVRSFALLRFLRVTVAAVTILAIHKYPRPPVATDCNNYNLNFCARSACQLGLYPIGLLHSGGPHNHPLEFAGRDGHVREQEMGPLSL